MLPLMNEAVVVNERLGEDLTGEEQYRSTGHVAFAEATTGDVLTADGSTRSRTALIILNPREYGVTWSVKPSDSVTWRGRVYNVLSVREVRRPQTVALHHIEVDCG